LEFSVEDARDYLLVPNLTKITAKQQESITDAFAKLCQRDVHNVFDEVKHKDRNELDAAILRGIGLDPKKFLKQIYDGLCELVRERIQLGEMRGKARKTKTRKTTAEKEVFQQVLSEVFPQGPKPFPDGFLTESVAKAPRIEVPVPKGSLVLDTGGFFPTLYGKNKSWTRQLKHPAEGKFILYAQAGGQALAMLPEKTNDLMRVVADYERYLREHRAALCEAFYRRTLDVQVANRLTGAAWTRLKLPPVPDGS
jgi:hypothetical protein